MGRLGGMGRHHLNGRRSVCAVGVVTHPGHERSRNEDAFAYPIPHGGAAERGYAYRLPIGEVSRLWVVADGVGGSEEGQRASEQAVRVMVDRYYTGPSACDETVRLEEAVIAANRAVIALAEEAGTTGSTTLTGLLVSSDRAVIAHVGDSRLYHIRDGRIVQVTQDHDLLGELVRSGLMTPEEASLSEASSVITRSIGSKSDATPDIAEIALQSKDAFVLCTDGLTRHVLDEEIARIVAVARTPQQAAQMLVDLALERGGKDNVTVMVIRSGQAFRPNLTFAIIRLLALIILLAGLAWSAYVALQQGRLPDPTVSPVATSAHP